MTTVVFEKTPDGHYRNFTCMGHAGARRARTEYDLLCCAVSALVTHTVNGLSDLAHEDLNVTENEKDGFLRCEFRSGLSEASALLVDSLEHSLQALSGQYGAKYLQVRTEFLDGSCG